MVGRMMKKLITTLWLKDTSKSEGKPSSRENLLLDFSPRSKQKKSKDSEEGGEVRQRD